MKPARQKDTDYGRTGEKAFLKRWIFSSKWKV